MRCPYIQIPYREYERFPLLERLVAMTNFDNDEALYRFQLIWKRLGIDEALKEKGVQEGETVRIRDMVFEYKDNA